MDIAKIRKKKLPKDAEKKPAENAPVSGPGEAEEKETETAKGALEGCAPVQEEIPGEGGESAAEDQAGMEGDDGLREEAGEVVELLTFRLSHEEYAFRVSDVEEILWLQNITPVPTTPDYMVGITSLRGKIIPVIDLKTRLNLQGQPLEGDRTGDNSETEKERKVEKKILIVEGPKGLIGAVIDKVLGVVSLPLSEILPPPGHLDEKAMRFIEGIVVLEKRFISVIHSGAAMDIEAG